MAAQAQQRGRAGGLALASKVDKSYFRWLGRRGGRRGQYNVLVGLAASHPDQIISSIYASEAARYHDEKSRVMLELWQPGNGSFKARPRARKAVRG
jgi:hypothetical protein